MPCANHPHLAEVATCAKCHKALCADCVVHIQGRYLCGDCKNLLVRLVERGERMDSLERGPSPWAEQRSLNSLLQTAKMVLLRPSDFFSRLNLRGNEHWSFIVVLGWPLGALGAVLQALCLFAYAGLFVGTASANDLPEMMAGTVFSALFVPVQLLLGVVIGGAVLHLFLRLVGGANAGIETTFRTYAYTGAVALITWVPFLGPLVGGIWQLVLILIGLKHMHDTTYGKVVLAVLVPVAIVTAVAAAVAGLFFLTGGMMGP